MASPVDFGPASNSAELIFGTNAPGLEVHVGNPSSALNPLAPGYAPFLDPNAAYAGTVINKVVSGIQVSIPS